MSEEEKQAAAYLKLQDDVRQLIVDVVFKELQNYGSPLHSHIKATTIHSGDFETRVKEVIKNQMNKY